MKFFGIEIQRIKKASRPVSERYVTAITLVTQPKLDELWEAVGALRTDLTGVRNRTESTRRKVYRDLEPDENDPDAIPLTNKGNGQKTWRTGDPVV